MRKIIIILSLFVLILSCKVHEKEKILEVKGVITNSPVKKIYLEEIPMTTMERILVDSSEISKEGKYKLKTETGEARVYNLRLDQSNFPLAVIINDAPEIIVNAVFGKENSQFPESYDVQKSQASIDMKEFMIAFNNKLQLIISDSRTYDSLSRMGAPDSSLQMLRSRSLKTAEEIKSLTLQALEKSNNPALSMFILGYYQSTAGYQGSGITALSNDEFIEIVEAAAKKFPDHQGLITIKSSLSTSSKGWVGQQAPEFELPDPNGKLVKLSSFRGKYVLVDFWASWCLPCREENPNVVKAYNRFRNKNFTILGVSLDQPGGKDAWLKAIKEDKLTWTQVSDLKYWNSVVVPLYRIQGIPYNVLVDPEGKIIAESLRGPDLEKKLEEVLSR